MALQKLSVRKLPVAAESDEEIWSETETVSVPLDTTRKYDVSPSGRKVHLFADCLGSNARDVRTLCRSLSERPSSSSTTRRRIKLQEGVSWLFVALSCFCSQQSVCQSAARKCFNSAEPFSKVFLLHESHGCIRHVK